eukprot:UN06548
MHVVKKHLPHIYMILLNVKEEVCSYIFYNTANYLSSHKPSTAFHLRDTVISTLTRFWFSKPTVGFGSSSPISLHLKFKNSCTLR